MSHRSPPNRLDDGTSATVVIANTVKLTVDATDATFGTNILLGGYIGIGSTPRASAGKLRFPTTTDIVMARKADDSADIPVLAVDSSNNILIGNDAAGALYAPAGVYLAANANTYLGVTQTLCLLVGGGTPQLKANATGLGFFNTTPVAKPTISGSREGNGALADLLADLATLGLVTDSTTAGTARAPVDAQYVTLATNSELTNESVLAGTAGEIALSGSTLSLATSGVTAGTYDGSFTVDSKGRVTAASNKTRTLATRSAVSAIANTETRVVGATIAANTLAVGDTLVFQVVGLETNSTTASTSVFRVRIGGTTLTGNIPATSSYVMGTTARTNAPFTLDAMVVVTAIGASGSAQGVVLVTLSHATALAAASSVGTAAVTINTTGSLEAELTLISGHNNTSWSCQAATLELKKA